jgi:protein required for attachment to host cells
MPPRQKKTWLMVGDGASAQFYSLHAIPLRLTKVPSGALKAARGAPRGTGHKPESRKTAHVAAGHGGHQRGEDMFVERIVEAMGAAAEDGEFDDIIVVLPPKALAHFRALAGPDIQKRVRREICGEWTGLTMPDLERHLAEELP